MKTGIHPESKDVTFVFPDGKEKFVTKAVANTKDGKIFLDVDYRKHPAWSGGHTVVNDKASEVSKFKEKFGGLGSLLDEI